MKPAPKAVPLPSDPWPLRLFAARFGAGPAFLVARKLLDWWLWLFLALFGALLGLALLKFANPPIVEKYALVPHDIYEFIFFTQWPIGWAYWLLGSVGLVGLLNARGSLPAPWWLVVLPLAWLGWQFVAAGHTLNPPLTEAVLAHFITCLVCFYLGLFTLSRARSLGWFWLGVTLGFLLVLLFGCQQHFGGLEATRHYHYSLASMYPQVQQVPDAELRHLASDPAYLPSLVSRYPQVQDVPPHCLEELAMSTSPQFLEKLASNRICSTLFYPNSLAGALLLLLPAVLMAVASLRQFTIPARAFLVSVIGLTALACLYWSGSKAGWLLMLLVGSLVLLRLPLPRPYQLGLIAGAVLLGLAALFMHHSKYFKKGATSVVARLDYWQAALHITGEHPVLGSGPGTFGTAYSKIKRPESEAAKLTHNDYLEQASDSGLPGFVTYSLFIVGALVRTAPRFKMTNPGPGPGGLRDWQRFAIWLGVLAWCLQGLFEFGLYIPALAWPALTLLGWLVGTHSRGSGDDHRGKGAPLPALSPLGGERVAASRERGRS